jgi:hypothetical protein
VDHDSHAPPPRETASARRPDLNRPLAQTVYTRRLGGTYQEFASTVALFTAAPEQHVVVRDIVVVIYATAAGALQIWHGTGATTRPLLSLPSLEPLRSVHVDLRQALEAGDVVTASSSAGPWAAVVTGYVFAT